MSDAVARLNAALEGRYRIESELGEGGMATVYLAKDLKHNRNVALKVLKPELAAVVGAERFLAEIEVTANLQHPHILPLFDSGEADGFLFYVMPYLEGETLRDRIDREKQLPVDEAVRIATGWPTHWITPIGTRSSTATSSQATSSCKTASPWCQTSGSHWLSVSRAVPGSPKPASVWAPRTT